MHIEWSQRKAAGEQWDEGEPQPPGARSSQEPARPGKETPISNTKKCYTINTRLLIESLQRKKYPVVLLASQALFLICFYLIPTVSRRKSFKKKEKKPLTKHRVLQAVYSPPNNYSYTALTFLIFCNKLGIETRFSMFAFFTLQKLERNKKLQAALKHTDPEGHS